jgi:hypothetical protein
MRTPFSRIQSESENEKPQPVVNERYERCAFCNSKLVFSHDLNINYLQVIETGRCAGCGVSMLPKKYTLH